MSQVDEEQRAFVSPCVERRESSPVGWGSKELADKPGSVEDLRPLAAIPLGPALLQGSSNLPGSSAGHASASLFGLAPDGVCRAVRRYRGRGELLPRRFTLACASCDAIGGLLSVALSVAFALRLIAPSR